jgi:hypothetical protein
MPLSELFFWKVRANRIEYMTVLSDVLSSFFSVKSGTRLPEAHRSGAGAAATEARSGTFVIANP